MDIPFTLLAGEAYIKPERLVDNIIHLTTYRLFISTTKPTNSSIDCPIRSIDSIVEIDIKDEIYLYIHCKHIRSFRLKFFTKNQRRYWLRKLNDMIAVPKCLSDLFTIKFKLDIRKDEHSYHDHLNDELIRLQLDTHPWRLTDINQNYELCSSYPKYCVVPSTITNEEIIEAAKFRLYKQFPTIVWRHSNGAIIVRAGQPEVGWPFRRSKEDEKMIQAIINACNGTLTTNFIHGETSSSRLLILHAASRDAAIENCVKYYTDCDVKFMNLPDIHAISSNVRMLRAINVTQSEDSLLRLASTRWLYNLSALMNVAFLVVVNVDKDNRSVLVHCSNGQGRTSQIITLAEIMLDSHYRTISGFQILVEREWIQFEHKFGDHCGHNVDANGSNDCDLVFLQWLDCIYQLLMQNQAAFQFNEIFLRELAAHVFTGLYGTFLCNTDLERTTANSERKTSTTQLINPSFDERKQVLYPLCSISDLHFWSELYLCGAQSTPGLFEHASSEGHSSIINDFFSNYCDTCGERIEPDQPQKMHESQHWHATGECYYCYTCRIPLNNRGFFPHYGELFCSNKCASQRDDAFNKEKKTLTRQDDASTSKKMNKKIKFY
ncbi:unnamed protein product [Rotaria sordida]|uniref:Phosphatidylinositol-3-phosphatase n=1 Tax=Rotaria sordida TaxID=392033 RepID=A0A815L1B3_9BILA|nr:unnamed protein product [Rotaria sordida]CAF3604059.1 unnamed protein product [Rotaria sordida]